MLLNLAIMLVIFLLIFRICTGYFLNPPLYLASTIKFTSGTASLPIPDNLWMFFMMVYAFNLFGSNSPPLAAFRDHSVRRVLLSEVEPQRVRAERSDTPSACGGDVHSNFPIKTAFDKNLGIFVCIQRYKFRCAYPPLPTPTENVYRCRNRVK
jgi:hypothetical protein